MKNKTYYLFGSKAVRILMDKGLQALKESIENEIYNEYAIFEFIEGETKSADIMYAFNGWGDYAIIQENQYNELKQM